MRAVRCQRRLLSRGVAGVVTMVVLSGCAEQTEPLPAPIVARSLGGDSVQPGPMVIICQADDAGCVPTYAVACKLTWMGDSTQRPVIPPLSANEQVWCVEHERTDSSRP